MLYTFQNNQKTYNIQLDQQGNRLKATIDGTSYEVEVLDQNSGELSLRFQGSAVTVQWANETNCEWLAMNGCTFILQKPENKAVQAAEQVKGEIVASPLPAQVRAVQVIEGDRVEKDQTLLLVEAMKMEIQVKAPAAGKILRVFVSPGQTVQKGENLVEILV